MRISSRRDSCGDSRASPRAHPPAPKRQRPRQASPPDVVLAVQDSPRLVLQPPYQPLSLLRTTYHPAHEKLKRQSTMQEPCCDSPVEPPPALPNCTECVQECEDACDVELTEQCTDRCVVVPCHDAHHDSPPCEAASFPGPCDIMCVDDADCSALESFLQSCTAVDYPHFFPDAKPFQDVNVPSSSAWSTNAFADPIFHGFHPHTHAPPHTSFYLPDSSSSTPQLVASPTAFVTTPNSASPQFPRPQQMLIPHEQTVPVPPQGHRCMWADCGVTFASMNELVGHVNLQHLRLPPAVGAPTQQPLLPPHSDIGHDQSSPPGDLGATLAHQNALAADASALACLWANCRVYPTPNSIPGPSIGNQTNNVLGVLASHLLQDHLGLPTRPPSPPSLASLNIEDSKEVKSACTPPKKAIALTPSPPISCPPTPAPEHDCDAPHAHVCRWAACGESFSSCDALTTHINAAHVGGGKAHYDCYWEGCGRNGESGFASKQKICRHLQSHTGHRPFQCKICQQNFSEAATLAQHMRRHTQEKPYMCDFPGCGKSFAITGALTIHKRTHNGHKPFKCTYCDKAFTESSNLSKHLRTHTGARPYPCAEPGCNKCFARPDQLARHAAVHRKKEGGAAKAAA